MVERVKGSSIAWKHYVEGGGGGDIEVRDDGTIIVPVATILNFTGLGVSVTTGGPGEAVVDIPGGSGPALQSATFLDNTTEDLALGPDTNGLYAVEANISNASGESTSYRFLVAVSGSGADLSTLQVGSDVPIPITTLAFSALVSAGSVILRITGSGAGTNTTVNYRIVDTIPRAF